MHGFVFECDILTRIEKHQLVLTRKRPTQAIGVPIPDMTWPVEKKVELAVFSKDGARYDRTLVVPQKWNHPEYDGLYIERDGSNRLHLVAWNASEAKTHKGSVSKLVTMLTKWAQRTENPISFETLRFFFIVPKSDLPRFPGPNDSECLLAKKQLAAWNFQGFEIWGTDQSDRGP